MCVLNVIHSSALDIVYSYLYCINRPGLEASVLMNDCGIIMYTLHTYVHTCNHDTQYRHAFPLQVFPGDLLAPTYSDPNNPDHLLARSEFERRGPYTALLEKSLAGGPEHPLFGLVRECLANTPERRPTTAELLSSLEEVGMEMDGGLLQLDIARVKTARTLRAKEKRIEVLQVSPVQ